MGYANDSQVIRERFEAQWPGSGSPTVQYTFAGLVFDPPKNAPWVRLTVLTGEEVQRAMGKYRLYRRTGFVDIGIFVPVGSGDGLAKELADRVAAIYRGRTVGNIVFRGVSLNYAGPDGAHEHHVCSVPYQADELVLNPN